MKILSNKLNMLMNLLQKHGIKVDEIKDSGEIIISPEIKIPVAENPHNDKLRTSRENEEFFKSYPPPQHVSSKPPVEPHEHVANASITQRLVDKAGKVLFLAEVEVMDPDGITVVKTRTNGVGKWSASLAPNTYKVVMRKRDKNSKQLLEATQNIIISPGDSFKDLNTFVLK